MIRKDVHELPRAFPASRVISNNEQLVKNYTTHNRIYVPKPIRFNSFVKMSEINIPKMYFSERGCSTRLAKLAILTTDSEGSQNIHHLASPYSQNDAQNDLLLSAFDAFGTRKLSHEEGKHISLEHQSDISDEDSHDHNEEEKAVS